MGLFNWASKGVKVERKSEDDAQLDALQNASNALNVMQTQQVEPDSLPTPEAVNPKDVASAVLFDFSTAPEPIVPAPVTNEPLGFNPYATAFAGTTLGNRHIMVTNPKSQHEIFPIVEHLKTNEAVIVNFEGLPSIEAQRFVDFLSGVACGLGGSIQALDNYKYIITPCGIGVR